MLKKPIYGEGQYIIRIRILNHTGRFTSIYCPQVFDKLYEAKACVEMEAIPGINVYELREKYFDQVYVAILDYSGKVVYSE